MGAFNTTMLWCAALLTAACTTTPVNETTVSTVASTPETRVVTEQSDTTQPDDRDAVSDSAATLVEETSTTRPAEKEQSTTQTTVDSTTTVAARNVAVDATVEVMYESFEPQHYEIRFGTLKIEAAGDGNDRALLETTIIYRGDSEQPALFDLTIGLANNDKPIGDWWFNPCLDDNTNYLNPGIRPDQFEGIVCIEAPGLTQANQIIITPLIDTPITININ